MSKRKNIFALMLAVVLTASLFGNVTAFADNGEIALSGICGDDRIWKFDEDTGTLAISANGENSDGSDPAEATYTGSCGDAATYAFYASTGTLVISGSGAMDDYYSSDDIPWWTNSFYYNITTVVIEDGITAIGRKAFYYCFNLTGVTIPDTVTTIGYSAFCNCESLESVTIPDSVTSIADSAFEECGSLSSVTFGNSVVTIGADAFSSCTSLQSAAIPDSVTSVDSHAFDYCTSLSSVTFGNSITTIDEYAFYHCESLESVELPESLTTIGKRAFYYTAITSVTIPASVTSMETGSFPDSTAITYAGKLVTDGTALSSTGYSGAVSSGTVHGNNYITWSDVINSYLFEGADGYIYRAEFVYNTYDDGGDEGSLFIEKYTTDYSFIESFEVPMELPLFGGFYAGSDGYYVVFGQYNAGESDTKEVIRVVKYSTGLVRMGSASLCGINTRSPFRSGSLSITEDDDLLYVRTSRGMYKDSNGVSHQANLSVAIYKESMIVADNIGDGYVSHSFNQLITVDDETGTVVAVDHGDSYPRSEYLTTYTAGTLNLSDGVRLFDFYGENGENETGASVGGLACSDTSYLVAFNSDSQSGIEETEELWYEDDGGDVEWGTRNVYVSVADKDDVGSFKTVQITSYEEGAAYSAATPQLVRISDELYAVMWEVMKYNSQSGGYHTTALTNKVYIAFLDGDGNQIGSTQTIKADLSECQPVVINGRVAWCVPDDTVTFYPFKATQSGSSVTISDRKATTVSTSLAQADVTLGQSKYTGSAVKPAVTVTLGDTTLTEGTDYTVSYSPATKIGGKGTVTIKGKGDYCDSITKTYTVNPPKVYIAYADSNAETITVAWQKAAGGVKYQVAYKEKGTSKWKTVTAGASAVSKTIQKLTKDKTYQVRVRAVKTVKGETYTGPWSSIQKIKVTGKKAQNLKVSKKTVTVKYSNVKKAAQRVKAIRKVSGEKGSVTYIPLSISAKASKFAVDYNSGEIRVGKGIPKGTYILKILVCSSAKGGYGKTCKVVSVKVKVK